MKLLVRELIFAAGTLPKSLGTLQHLRSLRINNSCISGEIPFSLGHLDSLEELWLSSNALSGFIPKTIAKLKQLKQLRLDHNNLVGEVPPQLRRLDKLEYLMLHENDLHIPDGAPLDDGGEMYYPTQATTQAFLQKLPLKDDNDAPTKVRKHHFHLDGSQHTMSVT